MSRRSSAGDLVPRDISEILAREGKAQRGLRKSSGSLGQAFSWLKGSRKKKQGVGNGQSRIGIVATDSKSGHANPDSAKSSPKGGEDQRGLAVHYTASPHDQENVFIQGSRPRYLEDLHSEAQQGLKIQQLEEHNNGVLFPGDESTARSADTAQPEQDAGSDDRTGSPESRTPTGNSVTTATSAVSAVSARPVLTRQGSTFKPLNPVKRLDKTKKRTRRTTIMGIPQQVQKELALHRSSTFQPIPSSHLPNGDGQLGVVIIPTIDGDTPGANQEGARVHLSDLEQESRDRELLGHHLQAVYLDEHPFSHQGLGSCVSHTIGQRPKSLAVPGMTTSSSLAVFAFLQEPQGPVMSISPQATYLSKIIPNAILPASVDVIQIDRNSSRTHGSKANQNGSSRTVSKSSLASGDSSASPASSRRSDRDGSHSDSFQNNSVQMPTSGSSWSQYQSSDTIISTNSSLISKLNKNISNSATINLAGQDTQMKQPVEDQDRASLHSSASMASGPSAKGEYQTSVSGISGSVSAGEMSNAGQDSKRNSRSFTRSLSVVKTKQPPAPPRRTNSLHANKIRGNSKELVDIKDLSDSVAGEAVTSTENSVLKDEITLMTKAPEPVVEAAESSSVDDPKSSVSSSPLSSTKSSNENKVPPEPQSESSMCSPQKAPSEGSKFERTMSPSSGYSSQSGTPTLSPKGISPTSPVKQKKKPVKPERSGSRASSSAASASSSLTSLSSTTETINQETPVNSPSPPQQESPTPFAAKTEKVTPVNQSASPSTLARELFNIPPPPKVKAPCPPPPETWLHNKRTFELLFGPCPNVSRLTQAQKLELVSENAAINTGAQTETSKDSSGFAGKQTIEESVSTLQESKERVLPDRPETLLETVPECVGQEQEDMESPSDEIEGLTIPEQKEANVEIQGPEQHRISVIKESQEVTPKKEPPPVMKKPTLTAWRASAERLPESQGKDVLGSHTKQVNSPAENNVCSSPIEVEAVVDRKDVEMDRCEVIIESTHEEVKPQPPTQTLTVDTPTVDPPKENDISPPPSPLPPYHPTPPYTEKSPSSSVTDPTEGIQGTEEEIHIMESCWPPPPPPLEGDSVFDGVDEMDFPPPPPPFIADGLADVVDSHTTATDVQDRPIVASEEVGLTVKDEIGMGGTQNDPNTDLPAIMDPIVVEESRTEDIISDSNSNTTDQYITLQEASSLTEGIPPPPVEAPPPQPKISAEISPSNPIILAPSNVPLPLPLQVEDHCLPEPPVSAQLQPPISVPVAPPLPSESQAPGVSFRRQPSLANRDTRSKEVLSRHKSAPIPKEDANIPLVTPSLLQMVRLRSVNVGDDQIKAPPVDTIQPITSEPPSQESCSIPNPVPQNIPQKPIRKSLSLKSPPPALKASTVSVNVPSMRLQEAIRMKTAAMSSKDNLPVRLGMRSSISSSSGISESGALSLKSPPEGDMHKTPASTASFIFSRSTKKVVIETSAASSPEAQASLKQSLAAELMQVSDHAKATGISNGGVKLDKVPPPVAKKPAQGSINSSQRTPVSAANLEVGNEANETVTTTTVTPDTIETLF